MTYPGATVDIIGADHRPDEFLHEVILLVGATGRRNTGDRIRAMVGFDLRQFLRNKIISLIPGGRNKCTILLNERGTYPVGMIVKRKRETPFQTGMALVGFRVVWRLDRMYLVLFDRHVEVTTHTAIGTYCTYLLIHRDRFGFEHVGDRRGWTSLRTGPAAHAIGLFETRVEALDDVTVESPAGHAQYKFALYFITGTHAAVTVDAFGKIRCHVRMTKILFPVQMVFPFGVTHIPNPHFGSYGLQFAVIIHLAGKAIERVIRKNEFDDVLP